MNSSTIDQDDIEQELAPLDEVTIEGLADHIFRSFSLRNRNRTSNESIANIVKEIDLSEYIPTTKAPRLRLDYLRIVGEKRLGEHQTPLPIDRSFKFGSGVNVVLIPDNNVGKSSIFKTIKFALTGDNSDYDADVKQWIERVWLTFSLDDRQYTILLAVTADGIRAVLVAGEAVDEIEWVAQNQSIFFDAQGAQQVQNELQHFFFGQLELTPLAWTQDDSNTGATGISTRFTSWKTYLQALIIPDSSDDYLLCDTNHSYGNQEGLILSQFLGLRLTEPLNRFHISKRETEISLKKEQRLSETQREQAKKTSEEVTATKSALQQELAALQRQLNERRRALTEAESAIKLSAIREDLLSKDAELGFMEDQRSAVMSQLTKARTRKRQLEEAIDFALHFTGLEVNLCPNCDAEVDENSIEAEHERHVCRLCGKPATSASVDEVAAKNEELKALEVQITDCDGRREELAKVISSLKLYIDGRNREAEYLRALLQEGLDALLPTTEEEKRRDQILSELGRLDGLLQLEMQRTSSHDTVIEDLEMRSRILEKARSLLRGYAQTMNANTMSELNTLTEEIVHVIGAESIDSLACSPLGQVTMFKNGVKVGSFNSIRNQGERWRIKLAFFVAMMQLSQSSKFARHPGLLLIDQPGTAEMVHEDLLALAQVFRHFHDGYSNAQIICFSAQEEFRAATSDDQLFGPQAGQYAF
jgi:hypothetical protein